MSTAVRTFQVGDFVLKDWEPGEEQAILASFNRVFAKIDPGFQPRSEELWRWQYLENPSGKLLISAFAPDGEVVAHHGFILQRLRLEGRESLCGQTVDTFVDPAYRRGLQRTSLSALLSNTFIPHTGGEGPGRHAFYWGAPIRVALRVGESLGGYEVIRTQLKLSCELESLRVGSGGDVDVVELADSPEDTGALFERCATPYGAIAVRDKPQLDWRYVHRPGRTYKIIAARRAGRLVGLAIYVQTPFDGREDEGLLCEWLVPPAEPGVRAALLDRLRDLAAADGAARLTGLFAHQAHPFAELQEHGFRAAPTQYPMAVWPTTRRIDADYLRDRWYYSLGDTDLV